MPIVFPPAVPIVWQMVLAKTAPQPSVLQPSMEVYLLMVSPEAVPLLVASALTGILRLFVMLPQDSARILALETTGALEDLA